jgi:hypothetical protein
MSKLLRRLVLVGTALLVIALALSVAFTILTLVGLVPAVSAHDNPAEGTKTLVIDRLYRTDPIEVVKVLGAGKEAEVVPHSPEANNWVLIYDGGHYTARAPAVGAAFYRFQSDDNWLSTLSFVLKNRTSKRIVLVAISIIFPLPAPAQQGPPYVKSERAFPFGELPAILAYTRAADRLPAHTKSPIRFEPGQEMTFALADRKNDLYYLIRGTQPMSDAVLCRVKIRVVFEDGIQWIQGDYYKPGPELDESTLLEEDYFPGRATGPATQ